MWFILLKRPRLKILGVTVCLVSLIAAVAYAHSVALLSVAGLEQRLDRGDLWRVVAYLCVPSGRVGLPFPCSAVHNAGQDDVGWATLPVAEGHILTVPTTRLSGIESPGARLPISAHYWQAAWEARLQLRTADGQVPPRDAIGLAINSAFARTQDQFHIHTACIKRSVRQALDQQGADIGPEWVRLRTSLEGSNYLVRRLDSPSLDHENIIDLLPTHLKLAAAMIARQTLVVVGARFADGKDGFYLLTSQPERNSIGDGEKLLDFNCRPTDFD